MTVPVWLLDVDGVLNAVTKKPDRNVWPLDTWISGKASDGRLEWPILAARPVLDFIREVHKAGRAEIRWHTTWQEHAAHIADLLDLPDFSVHPAPEYATYLTAQTDDWWKIPGALRVVEDEGRALLWTDDDADNAAIRPDVLRARGCPIFRACTCRGDTVIKVTVIVETDEQYTKVTRQDPNAGEMGVGILFAQCVYRVADTFHSDVLEDFARSTDGVLRARRVKNPGS